MDLKINPKQPIRNNNMLKFFNNRLQKRKSWKMKKSRDRRRRNSEKKSEYRRNLKGIDIGKGKNRKQRTPRKGTICRCCSSRQTKSNKQHKMLRRKGPELQTTARLSS
jgi:hypothetical protein